MNRQEIKYYVLYSGKIGLSPNEISSVRAQLPIVDSGSAKVIPVFESDSNSIIMSGVKIFWEYDRKDNKILERKITTLQKK